MDAIVELLMNDYGLSREQAEVYAEKVRGSSLQPDNRLKVEALNRFVTPHVERAKRIHYFNQLNARVQAGEPLTDEEQDYWMQVRAAEQERLQQESAAMLAARKMTQMAAPAASAIASQAAPMDLEIGPVQMARPVAPRSPAIPDPTRYELLPPVQAFTESFRDHSAPPADIDPVSGSPMDGIDFNAFREAQRQPQLDLEIGPVRMLPQPDPMSRLRLLEDAAARRRKHAEFWSRPENKARAKQLDDELLAERKRLRK